MSQIAETQQPENLNHAAESEVKDKAKAAEPQTEEEKKQQEADSKLAQQIADLIANALDKVKPITQMIQQVIRREIDG